MKIIVDAGICGFSTTIVATDDGEKVRLKFQSTCPHVMKAQGALTAVDALTETFLKPHETTVYKVLSPHLPHVACPVYCGFFKAIEAAAGLALPKDAVIHFGE